MPLSFSCPSCALTLDLSADILSCSKGHEYSIRNNIPRFAGGDGSYADAFGDQWNRFLRTQLDSHTGHPVSEERMRRCFGDEAWLRLMDTTSPPDVLEVGCGAGRFTEILLKSSAHLVSIDLSSAVDANNRNFPIGPKHSIAQADVRCLPFLPKQFDLVVCLGVIQHTPNPEETIAALYRQVKPDGFLVIDHYTANALSLVSAKPLFRSIFLKLSRERAFHFSELLVTALLPIHRAVAPIPIVRSIVGRVSPVYHYLYESRLSKEVQHEWAVLDTHDALTDYYKHFRSRDQIFSTLSDLGLTEISSEYGGNGVEARGRRPTSA